LKFPSRCFAIVRHEISRSGQINRPQDYVGYRQHCSAALADWPASKAREFMPDTPWGRTHGGIDSSPSRIKPIRSSSRSIRRPAFRSSIISSMVKPVSHLPWPASESASVALIVTLPRRIHSELDASGDHSHLSCPRAHNSHAGCLEDGSIARDQGQSVDFCGGSNGCVPRFHRPSRRFTPGHTLDKAKSEGLQKISKHGRRTAVIVAAEEQFTELCLRLRNSPGMRAHRHPRALRSIMVIMVICDRGHKRGRNEIGYHGNSSVQGVLRVAQPPEL